MAAPMFVRAALLAAVVPSNPGAWMTGTYRVTHCGDSISAMTWGYPSPGGAINIVDDVWRNLEHGRNAYTPGVPGVPSGTGTTWSIGKLAVERARPGGWAVIQDNGLGCSDWEWQTLLNNLVALCPTNVWLLGVLPGFVADVHPANAAICASRATVMEDVFGARTLSRFVRLGDYMLAHPEQFVDGQHPDWVAQDWLRATITSWTG